MACIRKIDMKTIPIGNKIMPISMAFNASDNGSLN